MPYFGIFALSACLRVRIETAWDWLSISGCRLIFRPLDEKHCSRQHPEMLCNRVDPHEIGVIQ
jgi:hypothetical protein